MSKPHDCFKHSFLACKLPLNNCDNYLEKKEKNIVDDLNYCGAEVADKIFNERPEEYEALQKDFFSQGWRMLRIEDSVRHLEELISSHSVIVTDSNLRSANLSSIFDEFYFIPFDFGRPDDELRKSLYGKNYHIRGSEFHSKCPLQIMYSTLDVEKMGMKFVNAETKSGTTRHEIAFIDSLHGTHQTKKTLNKVEELLKHRFNLATSNFTEILVEYEMSTKGLKLPEKYAYKEFFPPFEDVPEKILLRGTADAVFRPFTKIKGEYSIDKDTLVIFDCKRYRHLVYDKNSTKFQMLAYGLAIDQKMDLGTKNFLLISEHRNLDDYEGNQELPRYNFTFIRKNDSFMEKFRQKMLQHYTYKRHLLENPELIGDFFFFQREENKRSINGEENSICYNLYSGTKCFYSDDYCSKMVYFLTENNLNEKSPKEFLLSKFD